MMPTPCCGHKYGYLTWDCCSLIVCLILRMTFQFSKLGGSAPEVEEEEEYGEGARDLQTEPHDHAAQNEQSNEEIDREAVSPLDRHWKL